jgi:hypothetical protein
MHFLAAVDIICTLTIVVSHCFVIMGTSCTTKITGLFILVCGFYFFSILLQVIGFVSKCAVLVHLQDVSA